MNLFRCGPIPVTLTCRRTTKAVQSRRKRCKEIQEREAGEKLLEIFLSFSDFGATFFVRVAFK